MKNKLLSLLLAFIIAVEALIIAPLPAIAEGGSQQTEADSATEQNNENYITGMVRLTCNGESAVALKKGERLYAFTELDSSLGDKARYRWEVLAPSGRWATVSGYVFSYAIISEALLSNAVTDGSARVRCIAKVDEKQYVSDILTVTMPGAEDESSTGESASPARFALRAASAEDEPEVIFDPDPSAESGTAVNAFHVVINYVYHHPNAAPGLNLEDMPAANTFTVTLPKNTFYTGTVTTPLEIGYLPYVKLEQLKYVAIAPPESEYVYEKIRDGKTVFEKNKDSDGEIVETYVPANTISFDKQADDVTVQVYFLPQEVTYRIKIYEQNLYNDEYTLAETITKTGIANTAVGEGHDMERTGFSALYYDSDLSIDEDGSFALDIYYDRIYYLVDLDLNDKGDAFGAVNHFVRYKTPVVLPAAKRPGHSFVNWTLLSVKVDTKSDEVVTVHNYPETASGGHTIHSVEHNLSYKANWKVEKTSYTVIYWLENAEDDGFTLDSFKVVSGVTPGDTVDAPNDLSISDKSCFTFSSELSDKNVEIASDGTTAVNAYYLRNYYTMSFRGNASCITKEHIHTADCYRTCNISESHTHTADCYNRCGMAAHTHTAACGFAELICGKAEHLHTGECCSIEEHVHNSGDEVCCTIPYHVHGTGSASDCTKTEHTVHHDSCYSKNDLKEAESLTNTDQKNGYELLMENVDGPINGYVYRVRVNRYSTIYNYLYVHNHWFYLGSGKTYNGVTVSGAKDPAYAAGSITSALATPICGLELHTHGDGTCDCPITEHDHTSGCTCPLVQHTHGDGKCNHSLCGEEQHTHGVDCYTYLCGKTAHSHTADCVRDCQLIEHTHGDCLNTKDNNTFLQFKAKYNADISKIWRTVWEKFPNGERWSANTYFSQVLVYLPFMPPASITFTKNTSTTNKLYNISYYLEALGTTETEYKDKYFNLNNTVNAKYNHLTPDEDFFDIPGFTQFASNPAFSNDQISTTNGGPVSLYYERNEYYLEFVSLGTTISPFTKTLKYQEAIDSSLEPSVNDIPYPSSKEEGAIRFVGWYTTPNCADGTEFRFDGKTTMPIGGIVLYAKWEPCSYTVNVYANEKMDQKIDTQTVVFDSFIEEPNHILIQHPGGLPDHEHPGLDDDNHMIFAGWYYKVNGEEKRFDFNTMSVKFDMEIYAKWTSRIPVNYTIRYVYWNGTEYVDIAKPKTGASLAGVSKHFVANVDTDLYKEYRTNYFPEVRTHTMIMDTSSANNVFLFVYSSVEEIKYTVTHEFTDSLPEGSTETMTEFEKIFGKGNNTLKFTLSHTISGEDVKSHAASVAVSFREGVAKASLAEAAKQQYGITLSDTQATALWTAVTHLSPDYYIQDLILTTNSKENNALFTWKSEGDQALYQIIYYKESVDGTEFVIDHIEKGLVDAGTTVTATQLEIEHFKFDASRSKTSGKATALTIDPNTGGLALGLVLSLYYTRNEYTYWVYHYKQNSSTPMATVEGRAKYEHIIHIDDVAREFPGYTFVKGEQTEFKISNDGVTIECYYQGLEVNYVYQVIGMGATIDNPTDTVAIGGAPPDPRTLTLWSDGYFLNGWYYSIGDGERMPVPDLWLSNNNTVISVKEPTTDLAGQTVYIFAEVLPKTRRFRVAGYASVENTPQAFVFHLKGKAGTQTENIDLTFIIYDIGYIDISLLPYGVYTLSTLNWAWRVGPPLRVDFGGEEFTPMSGSVELDLNTTGEVVITYPETTNEHWLSDDVSGPFPISPEPSR